MTHQTAELMGHARLCMLARGRWHRTVGALELLQSWLGARVVTTWLLALLMAFGLHGLA